MLRCLYGSLVLVIGFTWGSLPGASAATFPSSVLESTVSVLPQRGYVTPETSVGVERPKEPEGSGIAVFDGTYIATAAHVLTGAGEVSVRLNDGRVLPAEIAGQDRFTDIALLKIKIKIPSFTIAEDVGLGESVCSVGNQFGLGLSVTCGVVSAVHRSNTGFNPIEDFIQTDAVVNPGASGGALINERGHLVGMLSGIFTKGSDANIGVNFAVHTELLIRVLDDLKNYGRMQRVRSGLVVRSLEASEMEMQTGVRIVGITDKSSAARAGLQLNDVIVTMKERNILYTGDVSAIVYAHRSGDSIPMTVIRDAQRRHVDLVLD